MSNEKVIVECKSALEAVEALIELYNAQIALIRERLDLYLQNGTVESNRPYGYYPLLLVDLPAEASHKTSSLNLGEIASKLSMSTTVTRPDSMRAYLQGELNKVFTKYSASVRVTLSDTPIPLVFAIENHSALVDLEKKRNLHRYFHTPNLVNTNDNIVDGQYILKRKGAMPLSLFPAQRVDYSLHRIRHYTATNAEDFQPFILFTNYQRYVDEFIAYGLEEVRAERADSFIKPGNRISTAQQECTQPPLAKLPQMPAYHLTRKNGQGVSLINIGVGPSNAKTITDHLAVLRPHAWLMIGHCGALRRTQRLGDYVLANAYLRDDGVLDNYLDPSIPLPTIAEVQLAFTRAIHEETKLANDELKNIVRTGTVVTTADRNWELAFERMAVRLNQSRAIAIDMESATIAANGYRYRVPYGTLLCASDKPIHGELKMPSMADAFYEERVSQHLKIGLRAVQFLAQEAENGRLHSRKLRSFDEPLFR